MTNIYLTGNNFQKFLRGLIGAAAIFTAAFLAGCGGGGGSSGDNDSLTKGGGGGASSNFDFATAVLTITGPITVTPNGVINLIARLLDAEGDAPATPGLFVALTPSPNVGTVSVNGVPNTGGGNTDANGQVKFSYQADSQEQSVTITAQASQNGVTKTVTHVITVDDGFDQDNVQVTITGPDTVPPTSSTAYVARVLDGSGNPPPDPINVNISPSQGTTSPNSGNTDPNGRLNFNFNAPGSEGSVTLTASTQIDGITKNGTKSVSVDDGFDFNSASFVITGPDNVAINSSNAYTATFRDSLNRAPTNPININIQPTQGTTSPNSANTDLNGQVSFNFNAPNNSATVTITLTAQENGQTKTGTKTVQVLPNNFEFTAPTGGTSVISGSPKNMSFNWTVAGQPVTTGAALPGGGTASQITLSVSGGGGGGGFRVSGGAPSNPVSVNANNGNFGPPVQIEANTTGGPATVTATANGGFSDTLSLTFIGSPSSLDLTVSPSSISKGNASTITATVRDGNNTALQGIQVNFSIDTCAGGGAPPCPGTERVNPLNATTNGSGQATSFYTHDAANPTGSAFVRATAVGGTNPSGIQLITVNP